MANAATKNQTRGEKLASEIGVSNEHAQDMEDIVKYMEKHRLPELFNEILTRILDERPRDAKFHIIECLRTIKKVKTMDPHCQKVYQFIDDKGEVE